MKLTADTQKLIENLSVELVIDTNVINKKHLLAWLNSIIKAGTYTKKDQNHLNNLRSKYLDKLKKHYIPIPTISQEPFTANVQVSGLSMADSFVLQNPCGEILIDSEVPLILPDITFV